MHWWQTPFSSASSSPSSSSKHHSDDSVLTKFFSIRSRAARSHQRRLNRSTKLRYDAAAAAPDSQRLWRAPSSQDQSSSRPSPVIPQPLPLPELAVLLRRDAAAGSSSTSTSTSTSLVNNIPLPSPKEPPSRSGEERERDDGLILDADGGGATPGSGFGGLLAMTLWKTKEHANTRPFRKSPKKLNVWSAPEMPPLDMNLGLGFSYLMFPEKTAFSVDSSPLHSPSANVHPLPLPRGATSPSQPTSISQITAKPDLMPIISQWQKGKLIGRGLNTNMPFSSTEKLELYVP
ncbi:mitogen-activated protein kinase kinase kinase 5 [Actinidia rufa]|uniref:Mitogen-activated protein kinase kinase kinase 5 n=1 Tax=Actinidia rufa TaxID=165716 RepID=A0A7J0HFD8_9ERIC|nr:mitogen-activated protein kinase kinase kinase 5 [Actinidia rufa]